MAKQSLPRVSAETAEALQRKIENDGASVLSDALDKLDKENPIVAANMRAWATTQPDPQAAMVGPGMMYALLRMEAEGSETKH